MMDSAGERCGRCGCGGDRCGESEPHRQRAARDGEGFGREDGGELVLHALRGESEPLRVQPLDSEVHAWYWSRERGM